MLHEAEIDAELRWYAEPDTFAPAERRLRENHMAVLVGTEGTGRRLGAIALLWRMPLTERRITVFSPAKTAAELAARSDFKPGRAYLLHDWIADGAETEAVRRFELVRLARKLTEAGAYLVVTRAGRAVSTELPWTSPDPGGLFDRCAGAMAGAARRSTEELAPARRRAVELQGPARVVALARQLARDARPVQEVLSAEEGGEVAEWFDTKPGRDAVHVVAALVFAYGLPERVFERQLARLAEIRRAHETEAGARQDDGSEPQTRMEWSRDHPLIMVCAEGTGGSRERRVVFRGANQRTQVLAELVARYGYTLWEPLREWVRSLACEDLELQIQAAAGVAQLARISLREVGQEFLDVWASGLVMERLAAANVLSLMCADDTLAPEALALALSWVRDAGQARAMTAAIALGGGLSIRYPADTLNWLWFLALRGVRVNVVARQSLTLLVRQAAERDGQALTALRLLEVLAASEVRGSGSRRTRTALDAVLGVLAGDRLDGGDPLGAFLLVREPGCAAHLGRLWAWVLRSAHHRGEAIRALRRTLRSLDGEVDALEAVTRLGEAIWTELPPDVAALVVERARYALLDDSAPERARLHVHALLSAIAR
ncbi:hypothetical protein [Nonomuraea sp. NPDC046570]|uniref:hypothetical protein n=1 Tax=Nonomuraea sp. NPDC046570 TaxID=3155255 RepID=UPI0033DAA3AB